MNKIGLIIGEFDPPHKGHIELIKYAADKCKYLYLFVTDSKKNKGTRLTLEQRKNILNESLDKPMSKESGIFGHFEQVELPNSEYSCKEVSKVWAKYLKNKYPQVTHIFSSEKYGDYLAEYMGITSIIFDQARKMVPISSTELHNQPFKYWDYMLDAAKVYYNKKVCIYGPESTGKSILAINLAKRFNTEYVPEIARTIMEENNIGLKDLKEKHFIAFAQNQYLMVQEKIKRANKVLICDTDNIVTQAYAKFYMGNSIRGISDFEIPYNLYLFTAINVPFYQDGTRNDTDRRKEMLGFFREELYNRGITYKMIDKETWEEREEQAYNYIKQLLEETK